MRVLWSEAALRDYERILDFVLETDGVGHAERLQLYPAIEGLSVSPERCRIVPELKSVGVLVYRELLVRPYRIPFRVQGDDVVLLAVLDGRRDLEETLLLRLTGA